MRTVERKPNGLIALATLWPFGVVLGGLACWYLFMLVDTGAHKHGGRNGNVGNGVVLPMKKKTNAPQETPGMSWTYTFDPQLYNIADDPYESTDLVADGFYIDGNIDWVASCSNTQYYHAQYVQEPEVPSDEGMYTTFDANGGLTPWLTAAASGDDDDGGPSAATPEQIYDAADAPHIVFIVASDWGWNDVGWRSTYLSWTTPNIDALAADGVKLDNHYSQEKGVPTRAAVLTGRYPLRLGLQDWADELPAAELPLDESTLAEELQSAGYKTYLVGKWDLGFSTQERTPTHRGFDTFYGHYTTYIKYEEKTHEGYLDLHDGLDLVTDADELDSSYHVGHLYNDKAVAAIATHADEYPDQPMFLYYAPELIHKPWTAPSTYTDRCGTVKGVDDDDLSEDLLNYCGLNVMLDETVANVTCALAAHGMADNTVLVLIADNGGYKTIPGNNYPMRGSKGTFWRGGVSSTAFIHSPLIKEKYRGETYTGTMHVTDWLPTLMHVATGGEWARPLSGHAIDGVDLWDAITIADSTTQRDEIVFYATASAGVVQQGTYRYYLGVDEEDVVKPAVTFKKDKDPDFASVTCDDPSLL